MSCPPRFIFLARPWTPPERPGRIKPGKIDKLLSRPDKEHNMAGKFAGKSRKSLGRSLGEARSLKWVEAITGSLKFCLLPKRWVPFFVLDLVAAFAVMLLFGNMPLESMLLEQTEITSEMFSAAGWATAFMVAWVLLSLWITGALIHQSRQPKEYRKSWGVAWKRYPSLLGAFVVTSVISYIFSSVPVFGYMFSLVISMAFLLVNQFVVIGGLGFFKAISGSVRTCWKTVFPIITAFALNTLLSLIIIGIFASPVLLTYLYYSMSMGLEEAMTYMLYSMDMALLAVLGSFSLLGFSISKVFSLRFITDVYLQMQRKRFTVF
jgi:hypothetical protein